MAYLLARCYMANKCLKKAKRYIGVAYGINPSSAVYVASVGILYAMCGQYSLAEEYLKAAEKEMPDSAEVMASLGRVY